MTIDGVHIDDSTDFARVAEEALHSRIGSSQSTTDNGAFGWLFRAWPILRGSRFADRLANALGHHLASGDNTTRYGALLFFVSFSDAGRISFSALRQAAANRAALRGVYPPDGGSADLEWWLLRAIASVAAAGESSALRLIEDEALRADGKVEPIMHTLITGDSAWFAQHRAEILRLHPSARDLVDTIEHAT